MDVIDTLVTGMDNYFFGARRFEQKDVDRQKAHVTGGFPHRTCVDFRAAR